MMSFKSSSRLQVLQLISHCLPICLPVRKRPPLNASSTTSLLSCTSLSTLPISRCRQVTTTTLHCSGAEAGSDNFASDNINHPPPQELSNSNIGFWAKRMMETAEMRARVAKLGLSAVLAYGLFDAVTYTTFFVLAFLGYEKSTGKNPAANLQALLGIVVLMWTGNNITRPFRVAGAAALAPILDKGLKRLQEKINLPNQIYAFALVVGIVAASCLTIVGFLILSKWGK